MEFCLEKCAMFIMKSGKRQMTEGIEQPTQEKIRTVREREMYKYLDILEVDTIKQVEMKEKKPKKKCPEKRENYSKQNYIAEIASKG